MSRLKSRRALVLALSVLAVSLSIGASTASAGSVGCTWATGPLYKNYTCLTINGEGTYVKSFRVTYKKGGEHICYSQAKVVVTSPSGYRWTYWSPYRSGCTWWDLAWFDFPVYRHYPSGSRACGTFYTSGVAVGPSPCNYIR